MFTNATFFRELSRRNVFRVAAAYVIVGWIVLQVVGLLAPNLGLPDWTVALVFVLLLSAFPIALFLTWAFEMTPDGVQKPKDAGVPVQVTSGRLDLGLIGAVLLLVLVTMLMPQQVRQAGDSDGVEVANEQVRVFSFAALPLDNLSDDLQLNFIADGISEDILTRLAGDRWFKVAARNSSFKYKEGVRDIPAIGEDLGVRYILEGSVRAIAHTVRVTVQLIEAETGAHVWADKFDKPRDELLLSQDAVVTAIVADISATLTSLGGAQYSARPIEGLDVRDQLILVANNLWGFENARLDVAERDLERLRLSHPDNALVRAQLAFVSGAKIRMGAQNVRELNELVSEHVKRAVQLAPGDTVVMCFVTDALALSNRPEEALLYAQRAVRLSPYSGYAWNVLTESQLALGQFAEALEGSQMTMKLQGERSSGYQFQEAVAAQALVGLGRFDEAELYARSAVTRDPNFRNLEFLVVALAHQGKIEEAQREAARLAKTNPFADAEALRDDIRTYNRDPGYVETMLAGFALAGFTGEEEPGE